MKGGARGMQSVRDIAEEIVAREGGFVNDPDDPGGATNFGVTIHTMRRLALDLDRDGDVDVGDVRALSRGQAVAIFIDHSYRRPGISGLPKALRGSVFDMYVNAGANAVKILQRLLREMGETVDVDGVIGPQTQAARRAQHRPRPIISVMPTGSRAAITISLWPTPAPRAANSRGRARAARAAGSGGPRSSSRRAFT